MILALLILAACLAFALSAGKDYIMALNSSSSPAAVMPPPQNQAAQNQFDTEIKFRKFFLTVPGAKQVELAADFNNWGEVPVILTPYAKGYFEISVALAAGEYKYIFLVDGKEVLDPVNKDIAEFNGRQINIKTVR